ncbi:hypothetical protein NECID01_1342 [Nematocida sp. AWRm77]|nr:hypothetical protein NECID01_1342 [Nematocida sp. AWRm77]
MHEGRFEYNSTKEGVSNSGPANINTTVLNALIYEYLIKKNYIGSAKVFKVEGDVSGINITQGSSALLDWFVAFNDLYNVRSGRGKVSGIAGKIDSILGKNTQEEPREEFQGRFTPTWFEKPKHSARESPREKYTKEGGDLLNTILEIEETDYPSAQRKPRYEKEAGAQLAMKEVSKLRLHSQKISTMSICHKKKILVTGGMDAFICIVDLANLSDMVKFEPHTMQISQVKVKETESSPPDSSMYFGSASLDREAKVYKVSKQDRKLDVSVFLYLKGHKSSIKAIDFGPAKIYTMGIDGELRIWSMDGQCLGAFALRRTVKMIASRSDQLILICDVNSISLFNPETAMYVKDIAAKGALSLYKTLNNTLFVLADSVVIYDKMFYSHQVIPLPSERIHSGCTVGGRLFLGGYQMVYEVFEKAVYKSQAHEGIVSAIEGTVINNCIVLLTSSREGEVKIWEVQERAA